MGCRVPFLHQFYILRCAQRGDSRHSHAFKFCLCIASRIFDLGGVFCFDDIVGDLTCVRSATLSNHASLCLPQVFCQSAIEGAQNDHASKVHAILANKAHWETQGCFFFARVDSCKVLFLRFYKTCCN